MYWSVKISARIISIPTVCCCCYIGVGTDDFEAKNDRVTGVRVIRVKTHFWSFKICHSCNQWISSLKEMKIAIKIMLGISLASMFFLCFTNDESSKIFLAITLALTLLIATIFGIKYEKIKDTPPNETCNPNPVIYEGWYGTVHSFCFANQKYAETFADQNRRKLVSQNW